MQLHLPREAFSMIIKSGDLHSSSLGQSHRTAYLPVTYIHGDLVNHIGHHNILSARTKLLMDFELKSTPHVHTNTIIMFR